MSRQNHKSKKGAGARPASDSTENTSSSSDDSDQASQKGTETLSAGALVYHDQSGDDGDVPEGTQAQSADADAAAACPWGQDENIPDDQVTVERAQGEVLPDGEKIIDIRWLRWDKTGTWGQIRQVDDVRVSNYFIDLWKNEPKGRISCLVRSMGAGMS
jgi:hypothetical protein